MNWSVCVTVIGTSLLFGVSCWGSVIEAQRAPCYKCELFKQQHPETTNPYEEIRSHCTYPCECPAPPRCPVGVHQVTDGCGCCLICSRQEGEHCDGTHLCDDDKGLVCEYSTTNAATGICRVIRGISCKVGNVSYIDGETFQLDCRTQCTCQNGTYGCVSLCAQEKIRPSSSCINSRLIEVPGRCCREWMCASQVVLPKDEANDNKAAAMCDIISTDWSPCSTTCGIGVSIRLSNDNEACQLVNETRLCQIRPCQQQLPPSRVPRLRGQHHIRKSHFCRATIHPGRLIDKVRLGNCVSEKYYRTKYCGGCGGRSCCWPQYTTTVHLQFRCPDSDHVQQQFTEPNNVSLFYSSTSSGSVVTYPVMSILKCVCSQDCVQQAYNDDELEMKSRRDKKKTTDHHHHHQPDDEETNVEMEKKDVKQILSGSDWSNVHRRRRDDDKVIQQRSKHRLKRRKSK